MWRRHWAHVIPFFAYPPEVRKMIYATNAIESLNAKLRRSVRIRGHFPNDEAAMKLIWLQLRQEMEQPPPACRDLRRITRSRHARCGQSHYNNHREGEYLMNA